MEATTIHTRVRTVLPGRTEAEAISVYQAASSAYEKVVEAAGGAVDFHTSSTYLHEVRDAET